MKVVPFAIKSFATFVVGDEFRHVVQQVKAVESDEASGKDKRSQVIEAVETMGLALGGWLLNLAIELAVALIRSKA